MILHRFQHSAEVDRVGAELILSTVRKKPNAVLGLATGSTPVGTYAEIVREYEKGLVSLEHVTTFNLDEYVGLPSIHPESYRSFMQKHLFGKVNLVPENTHIPDGNAAEVTAECRRYDSLLRQKGPVDLQLLGIGHNGHIGFNEPATNLSRFTHKVALSDETRRANQRFFDRIEDVPSHAITMGLGSILQAKTILLIAKGPDKLEILDRTLNGPITTQVPASLLQMHPQVIVLTDCPVAYKYS